MIGKRTAKEPSPAPSSESSSVRRGSPSGWWPAARRAESRKCDTSLAELHDALSTTCARRYPRNRPRCSCWPVRSTRTRWSPPSKAVLADRCVITCRWRRRRRSRVPSPGGRGSLRRPGVAGVDRLARLVVRRRMRGFGRRPACQPTPPCGENTTVATSVPPARPLVGLSARRSDLAGEPTQTPPVPASRRSPTGLLHERDSGGWRRARWGSYELACLDHGRSGAPAVRADVDLSLLVVPLTLGLAHSGTRGDGHESRPHRSPTARDGGGGWWAPVERSIW